MTLLISSSSFLNWFVINFAVARFCFHNLTHGIDN